MRVGPSVAAMLVVAGCAGGPAPQEINDPFEPFNRVMHASNKASDKRFLRPASQVYGKVVPGPVRQGLSNVVDVLELPGDIANGLLQGRFIEAGTNTLRLGANLTLGLGGLFDFADAAGMPEYKTDFGETLAVWGVAEGPYLELPFVGPSTVRDAAGRVVDLALDPVGSALDADEVKGLLVARLLSRLNDRYRYSGTVDSLLYDSADSYAQARLLYLQNRRFELGQTAGTAGEGSGDGGFIDPYED
jgi:phospholipid-binding lipoprotein MlaA